MATGEAVQSTSFSGGEVEPAPAGSWSASTCGYSTRIDPKGAGRGVPWCNRRSCRNKVEDPSCGSERCEAARLTDRTRQSDRHRRASRINTTSADHQQRRCVSRLLVTKHSKLCVQSAGFSLLCGQAGNGWWRKTGQRCPRRTVPQSLVLSPGVASASLPGDAPDPGNLFSGKRHLKKNIAKPPPR